MKRAGTAALLALTLTGCSLTPAAISRYQQAARTKLPDGYRGKAVVERVVDGDTIELTTGDRVRYIGMDTPETVDPRKPVQCFGHEAAEKNRELVEGKEVTLLPDVEDRDKYGRFLRYVYLGDTFINLELVQQGYAYAYPYPPSVAHEAEFRAAEAAARKAKLGLWQACPPRPGH